MNLNFKMSKTLMTGLAILGMSLLTAGQNAPVKLKVPAETALDSLLTGLQTEMEGRTNKALSLYLDQLEAAPHAPAALAILQRVARMGIFSIRQERTREVMNHMARTWPDVDPHARLLALRVLADMAQLDGDPASIDQANRDLGKISRAWVTPPSSFTPVVDTLESWQEALPPWPKAGGQAKFFDFREGFIRPPDYLVRQGGPTHAASGFFVPKKTKIWIILRGTDSSRLWLDHKEVVTLDWVHSHQPDHLEALVEVSAGWHRLDTWFLLETLGDWSDILLLSEDGKPLEVKLLPKDGSLPNPRGRMIKHLGSIASPSLGWAKNRQGEPGRLLEALLWRALDNTEESQLVLRNMKRTLPQTQFLLADGLVLFPGYLPYREAAGQARSIFQALLSNDPELALVQFRLADLLSDEDEGLTSLEMLEKVVTQRPDNPEWMVPLFATYAQLGWELEARQILLKGLEKFPGHGNLLKAGFSYFQQKGDLEWTTFCAAHIRDLEPLADEYGQFLIWSEKREQALDFFRHRIEVLKSTDDTDRRAVLGILISMERLTDALDWMRTELLPLNPENPDYQAIEARLLDSVGKYQEADGLRAELAKKHPEERAMRDLQSLRKGELPFQEYRTATADIIAQRPDPSVFSGADGVYLMDFGVTRFEKSGAQISRYHQVLWVLTKNGIDQFGEVNLPAGARPILVRTIKKDGSILVPEDLGAKGSISMPGLEPGDFIELEYTTAEGGGAHGPGSTSNTSAFIFQSVERPFWVTHFVIQVPKEIKADVLTSNLPTGAKRRTMADGYQEYSWRYEGLPRLTAEPNTADQRNFVPWVEIGFGVDWKDIQRQIVNYVVDKSPWTPVLDQEMKSIVEGKTGQQGLEQLIAWLQKNIEGEEVSTITDPSYTILSRRGMRLSVVAAYLQHEGIEFDWLLLRNKRVVSGLPSTVGFSLPTLRYRPAPGKPWVWITLASQFAPIDFIPEMYRGGKALVCNLNSKPLVDISEARGRGVAEDVTTGEVIVQEDGGVKVKATMTFSTGSSMGLRRALRPIPPDQLDKVLEQFLGSRHESGVLLEASADGLESNDGLVSISYKWYYGAGLRDLKVGQKLLKSPVLSLDLAASLASLPARKLPLEMGSPNAIVDRWTVTLPAGWSIGEGAKGKGKNNGNQYTWSLQKKNQDTWSLQRRVFLEGGIIQPEGYPDFAAFLRDLGALEETPLILKVP